MEVQNETFGKTDSPSLGKTAKKGDDRGMVDCSLSMSHTQEYAIALVLLIVDGQIANGNFSR